MPQDKQKKKEIVFFIEYSVVIDDSMTIDLTEILDKLRESGTARVIDAELR